MAVSYPVIKAGITGWNPIFFPDVALGGDHPLPAIITLEEIHKIPGTPMEAELESLAKGKGADAHELEILLQGHACRLLLDDWRAARLMVPQLIKTLPPSSAVKFKLQDLIIELESPKKYVQTKALRKIGELISESLELRGKAGNQLLHEAYIKAVKAEAFKLPYAGGISIRPIGTSLTGTSSHNLSPVLDKKKIDPIIPLTSRYLDALKAAASECDHHESLLADYDPGLEVLRGGIAYGVDFVFDNNRGTYEPHGKLPKILLSKITTPLFAKQRRPQNAHAVTWEEANELLHAQRKNILDVHSRRIVDYILSSPDVQIRYIGGNITHLTENNEGAGGGAYTYDNKNNSYLIELSSESSFGMLVHECVHTALLKIYKNKFRPYEDDCDKRNFLSDRKLFLQCLRADTVNSGMEKSELRRRLGITRKLYKYKDFAAEIPAYIIMQQADENWIPELTARFPHLTAYVEKIIIPDIELWASGRKEYVQRPSSIEELVSSDWPLPDNKNTAQGWTGRASSGRSAAARY